MNRTGLAAVAWTIGALLVLVGWRRIHRIGRTTAGDRLFTLEQRRTLGVAYGANCIFRPCHWLPATAAAMAVWWDLSRPIVLALIVTAGIGLPAAPGVRRCAGTIQGGHQRAASRGGTTSLWNGCPECGVHNVAHSAESTLAYACRLGPVSLLPYLVRVGAGQARLLTLGRS